MKKIFYFALFIICFFTFYSPGIVNASTRVIYFNDEKEYSYSSSPSGLISATRVSPQLIFNVNYNSSSLLPAGLQISFSSTILSSGNYFQGNNKLVLFPMSIVANSSQDSYDNIISNGFQMWIDTNKYQSQCFIYSGDSMGNFTMACPLNAEQTNITSLRMRFNPNNVQVSPGIKFILSLYCIELYDQYADNSVQQAIQNAQNQAHQDNQAQLDQDKKNAEQAHMDNQAQLDQDKKQHDEMMNSDISSKDKELPDDSNYQDYNSSEKELLDQTKNVDLDVLDIGIDVNSSKFIWDNITKLIQTHSRVFGMFIAILSIGIIKLAFGR